MSDETTTEHGIPDPRDAAVISFDCYGTLIDWRGGVREAVSRIAELADVDLRAFAERRIELELIVEHERYRDYDEVLALSVARTAAEFGVELPPARGREFADSLRDWPPFEDAPRFLQRLRRLGVPIAILSNVTQAGLRGSVRRLGAPFDLLITAEELRSYKPAPAHWAALQARLGISAARQLHVGGSIAHDIRPAVALGAPTVWVNREGETAPPDATPTLMVTSLDELAERWRLPDAD